CLFGLFFFQAEDGIRDFHVTGVQTCALPILPSGKVSTPIGRSCLHKHWFLLREWCHTQTVEVGCKFVASSSPKLLYLRDEFVSRSEERRVGKGCRAGGTRYTVKQIDKE